MNARRIRTVIGSALLLICIFCVSKTIGTKIEGYDDDHWIRKTCCNIGSNILNQKLNRYGKIDKAISFAAINQMPMLKYVVSNYSNMDTNVENKNIWLENQIAKENNEDKGNVDYILGETYVEELPLETASPQKIGDSPVVETLMKNKSADYLLNNFYIIDSTTKVDKTLFDVNKLLSKDFSIKKKSKPQILIFHTHGASEYFSDSRLGHKEDSVIGVGRYLTKLLEEKYGYEVIHDETQYDDVNGRIDRSRAYNYALPSVKKILEKNKSIEVVIDLHRDGVSGKAKRVTTINGKQTAKFMFFNGISRNTIGPIAYLYNPNLEGNLAFSLQLKLKAMEKYKDLVMPNYLKGYRYNLHLKEKSLLIELGNQNNTLEEVKNAMEPLADILNEVLVGK